MTKTTTTGRLVAASCILVASLFFVYVSLFVVVLHAGGRLVPGGIASPPGSGGSTGNTGNSNSAAAAAAAAAARRGNRRLTRNESRYHSGEYHTYTQINGEDLNDAGNIIWDCLTHPGVAKVRTDTIFYTEHGVRH